MDGGLKDGPDTSLELGSEAMEQLAGDALRRIIAHLASLPEQPASDVEGGAELARSLVEPLPETGAAHEPLFDLLFERLIPKSFNTAGPGYLAYIPGGGLFQSAVAELIAAAVNRYTGVWPAAPGLVQLEANVTRWFADLMGYPATARGLLTSGGSLANWTAVVTARCARLPENFLRGTLYASDQVHHSLLKAVTLAGFPARNLRRVPSDDRFRLDLEALRKAIGRDREVGFQPFLVVGSAGTTNTGAVDDLAALAALAAEEGLWLHVDAAYGGFFQLTARGKRTFRGIGAADSITLDPHKGLFLPYGTGCLLVRDGKDLARAHAVDADYLPPAPPGDDLVSFAHLSPELSRSFRGLRVWLPLKMHGAAAFRAALDEKLDLTRWAAEVLATIEGVEILDPPQLSIVAFRLRPPGCEGDALDHLNRALLDAINARQHAYLSGTVLDGRFTLRICVLSFRTHRERMEAILEDIRAAAAEVGHAC